ncbi:hypothetical protein MMPV_007946 [Pyropia vietnamensis]
MAPSAFVLPLTAAAAPGVGACPASATAAGTCWRGGGGGGGGGLAAVAPRLRHAAGCGVSASRARCPGRPLTMTPTASAQGVRGAGPPTTSRPPVILLVLQLEALAAGACPPGSRLSSDGGTSGDPDGGGGRSTNGSGNSSGVSGDSRALTELVARLTTHKAAGGRAYVVGATSGPPAEAVRLLEMLAVDAPPPSPPSRRTSRGAGFGPSPARAAGPTRTPRRPWHRQRRPHALYQSGYRTADPLWEETVSKSGAWAPKPIAWVVSSSFGEQLSPAGSLPPAPRSVSSAEATAAPADSSAGPADAAHLAPPSVAAADGEAAVPPPPPPPSPPPVPARRPLPAAAGQAARNRLAFDIAPSVSDTSALAADVAATLAANGVKVRVTVKAGPDGRPQVVCSPAAASVADAVAFVQKMLGVKRSHTLVYGRKPFVVDAVGGKGDQAEPVGLAVVDGGGRGESNEVRALLHQVVDLLILLRFLTEVLLAVLLLGVFACTGCRSVQHNSPGLLFCDQFDRIHFFLTVDASPGAPVGLSFRFDVGRVYPVRSYFRLPVGICPLYVAAAVRPQTSESIYCSKATGAAAVIDGLLHHAVL